MLGLPSSGVAVQVILLVLHEPNRARGRIMFCHRRKRLPGEKQRNFASRPTVDGLVVEPVLSSPPLSDISMLYLHALTGSLASNSPSPPHALPRCLRTHIHRLSHEVQRLETALRSGGVPHHTPGRTEFDVARNVSAGVTRHGEEETGRAGFSLREEGVLIEVRHRGHMFLGVNRVLTSTRCSAYATVDWLVFPCRPRTASICLASSHLRQVQQQYDTV